MEKQVRLKGVIEMAAAHLDRLQYALASAALDHEKQRERMKEEAEAHIDSVDSNLSLAGVPAAGQHDAAADSSKPSMVPAYLPFSDLASNSWVEHQRRADGNSVRISSS